MKISKYSKLLIIAPIIISLLFIFPLLDSKINPDLTEYLPEGTPAGINMKKIDSVFGEYDPFVIIVSSDNILNETTLERIDNITYDLELSDKIDNVISIFTVKYIRGERGMMLVDPVIDFFPSNEEERSKLKEQIKDNPLAINVLVSSNFKHTAIIVEPQNETSDFQLYNTVTDIIEKYSGEEEIRFSGMPYLRHEIQRSITHDLYILLPIGLLIMVLFLYFSFREVRGVMLPLSVVLMSIVLSLGLMPLFGFELSIIAILTPVLMIAVANNYGIHIISRYQEINTSSPDMNMRQIADAATKALKKPVALTGITTIAGILGMTVHIMLPARQMGVVSAIGIGYALILSLTFLPSVLSRLSKGKIKRSIKKSGKISIDILLKFSSKITTNRPKAIILFFILIFIVTGAGISKLRVSINNEEMMSRNHQIREATDISNKWLGGTKHIALLFKGDIMEPEVMMDIIRIENELTSIPEIDNVMSISSITKLISKALNDPGDRYYDTIPDSRNAIAQYIEFYNMSGDPDDFEKLVDFNYENAILNIQFKAESLKQFNRIDREINRLADESPYCEVVAGLCLLEKEMAEAIVEGQIYSLLIALLAIIILLAIIFGAFKAGVIGAIPLLFTIVCNFGLMGWTGIELNIATSLLSSVAIGIGVDYTIHIFWRIKQELSDNRSYESAIAKSLITTGRGISINAFSVMLGFSVLFFSSIVILKAFAFLIVFSILLCLLCALILIPAICMIHKPDFLNNKNN